MSNSSIMSVRDLIQIAFGDTKINTVNFKIIQTILYLLARQLRVLGRRVEITLDKKLDVSSSTTITVTEVKMQAAVAKKKKDKAVETKTPSKRGATQDPNYGPGKKDYYSLLEEIEEKKERELRVIRQRVHSREEAEKSPTPMASLNSIEMQYEKLLVVERSSSEDAEIKDQDSETKTRKLSVVTQDQFQALAGKVRDLQSRFGEFTSATFPENIELMQELRKGASLTDAMAALQMSARLEAAEKTLEQMLSLVTYLASTTSGVDLKEEGSKKQDAERKKSTKKSKKTLTSSTTKQQSSLLKTTDEIYVPSTIKYTAQNEVPETETEAADKNWITFDDLDSVLQNFQNDLLTLINTANNDNTESANNTLNITKKLETKLEAVTRLAPRMQDLEALVTDYANQINDLDTGLSAQMTNYQEQLTQMQHDLEIGLENMSEALANTGGDTTALSELNTNFTLLQEEFDRTLGNQKDLREMQNSLHQDLQGIWLEIEKLREIKPDREEVLDALRDKAGIKALNGLVTQEHFDAVRGDFQKNIGAAYDKFNNQENVWQKVIDDIFRELSEKADIIQINGLRNEIEKNIEMLNNRIKAMSEILGEPIAAATTRKLFRDTACLSCGSPANMEITEKDVMPKLPAFPTKAMMENVEGEGTSKLTGAGDHDICIPGKPVTHQLDSRSEFCHRYCGGGNVTRPTTKHIPVRLDSAIRIESTGLGSDGKSYMVDKPTQPCAPCNETNIVTTQPIEADQAPENGQVFVFTRSSLSDVIMQDETGFDVKVDSVSVTPRLPIDDD